MRFQKLHKIQESEAKKFKKKLEESEEAKSQVQVAWKVAEDVQARDEAFALRDNALATTNSQRTAYTKELKRVSEEEEHKLAAAQENTVSKFTSNLEILVALIFVLGFTKTVDEVSSLLSTE